MASPQWRPHRFGRIPAGARDQQLRPLPVWPCWATISAMTRCSRTCWWQPR